MPCSIRAPARRAAKTCRRRRRERRPDAMSQPINAAPIETQYEQAELPEHIELPPRRSSSVLRLLWRNPLGAISLVVLILIALAAIILPIVLHDRWDTPTSDILAHPSARHW